MQQQQSHRSGFHIIDVLDKITMFSNLTELRDMILGIVEKGTLKIAVRFPADSYFSSRSIAVVVTCNERIRDAGGTFVIIQPNDQIRSLLVSLGIEDRFDTCISEEDLDDY